MTEEKVMKLISDATKVELSKIKPETSFVEDLNLDSLDIVELMMKFEDDFGVEIPEEDRGNYNNYDQRLDVENAETFKKNEFLKACDAMGVTKDMKSNA